MGKGLADQARCEVQGTGGSAQNGSVAGSPRGSSARLARYRLPVEI